jgi:hypothetical protein
MQHCMNLCQCMPNQKFQWIYKLWTNCVLVWIYVNVYQKKNSKWVCKLWFKCVSTKRVSKFEHKVNVLPNEKDKLKIWSSNLNHKFQFTKIKFVYTNYNKNKHPHLIHQISSTKNKITFYVSFVTKPTTCFVSTNQIDHYCTIM